MRPPTFLYQPWLRRWCLRLWLAFVALFLFLVGSYLFAPPPTQVPPSTLQTTKATVYTLFGSLALGWMASGSLLWFWIRQTKDTLVFPSPLEHPLRYAYRLPQIMPRPLCQKIIEIAEQHPWTRARHTQATQDQPLRDLPMLQSTLEDFLQKNVFPLVAAHYEIPLGRLGIKEVFVVRYDTKQQSKLDIHRDASLLTASLALNDQQEYMGGGTYFPCISEVFTAPQAGDLLMHCGKLQHGGYPIREGVRYLLVCFIDCTQDPRFDHKEIATWNSAEPEDYEVMKRLGRAVKKREKSEMRG